MTTAYPPEILLSIIVDKAKRIEALEAMLASRQPGYPLLQPALRPAEEVWGDG